MTSLSSTFSGRFAFLTRWFRRHQDESRFDATTSASAATHVDDAIEHGDGNGNGHGNGADQRPPRRSLLRRRDSSRERSLAHLQQAYEEVVELVHTLKHHMDAQSERSERLLEMMEGLPEALRSLPEAHRAQTQTLQVIEGHLKQQNRQTEGLTQAIQGLAKAAGNQEHAMNLIQQQLDAGQDSREQLHRNFATLGDTLEHMSESSQSTSELITRLSDKHEQSDAHVQQLIARNQRQMTMMSIVSWSLAIVALTVAGAVAVWVGQQINATSAGANGDASAPQVAGMTGSAPAAVTQELASDATAAPAPAPATESDAAAPVTEADAAAPIAETDAAAPAETLAADPASFAELDASIEDLATTAGDLFERFDTPIPWMPTFDPHAAIFRDLEPAAAGDEQ